MDRFCWSAALGLVVAVIGCSAGRPAGSAPSTRPAPVSLSLEEVRQMLGKELTVSQLKQRLGEPLGSAGETWGNLSYALPGTKYVTFGFKGPYVTEARYDQTEVRGVCPKTHPVSAEFRVIERKMRWHLEMDGREFAGLAELGVYIRSLPKASLVEYRATCDIIDPHQPLRTAQDRDELTRICREAGVVLLVYPAG